jgi:hypothetical protein
VEDQLAAKGRGIDALRDGAELHAARLQVVGQGDQLLQGFWAQTIEISGTH